jgi:hypothetical protein
MLQDSTNSDDTLGGVHDEHTTNNVRSGINGNSDVTVSTSGAEVEISRPPSEVQEQSELAGENNSQLNHEQTGTTI